MAAEERGDPTHGIAVIGMACRFPGARNPEEFWRNLREGVEAVRPLSDAELAASGIPPDLLARPDYVKAGSVLEDVEGFDAELFGYSPREAAAMDPQHRLFLEGAWEALEDAGYDARRFPGAIGVWAGASLNSYLLHNLAVGDGAASVNDVQALTGSDKDYLTTRVSYKLGLRGPSLAVQTACSTSLVAVCEACEALLAQRCDMALAGGVSIRVPQARGYRYQRGGILSPDGHCRAFDAGARGTVPGNGMGVVVLKRVAEARADGDAVRAVIAGWAVNNDGAAKVGYTAPSLEGQAEVIVAAQAMAGFEPDSIGFVEGHGTGTELGDPIEVAALTRAFRRGTERRAYCALGSVKTNLGHTDTAAGIASLLKAVFAVERGLVPPNLHFERPNPRLDLAESPFFVNAAAVPWPAEGRRRAGVSSFGIGGTNAHVVLEEAPPRGEPAAALRAWQILPLSARSPSALSRAERALVAHLRAHPEIPLADAASTLQAGRRRMERRRALVCRGADEAAEAAARGERAQGGEDSVEGERPVAFLFPGQGAQRVDMGRELYEEEPAFRRDVDAACELLREALGLDLRALLYPPRERRAEAAARLDQTALAQPALFVVEHALARLWMSWGVRPEAMLGHSLGEYVAACLAGVFPLEEALDLVAFRGRLVQELPAGAMLSVALPAAEVEPLLADGLAVAALNAPALCAVSGSERAVDELAARLAERGIESRRLHTSHAFHSPMMEPVLAAIEERVAKVPLCAPGIPYLSNVTGTWITAAEATSPAYWARQVREPARIAAGLAALLVEPARLLLEVGPGRAMCTLATLTGGRSGARRVVASLPGAGREGAEEGYGGDVPRALAVLWVEGAAVDWAGYQRGQGRRSVSLPTYPFERKRHWIEPEPPGPDRAARSARGERMRSGPRRLEIEDRLYVPSWRRTAPPVVGPAAGPPSSWLVLDEEKGLGAALALRLRAVGHAVTEVRGGAAFARDGADAYRLAPTEPAGYEALLADVERRGRFPDAIVHLWSARCFSGCFSGVSGDSALVREDEVEEDLARGFYSVLHLSQALARRPARPVRIAVATRGAYEVTGGEGLRPGRAAVLGPVRVVSLEHPELALLHVDLDPGAERAVVERAASWLLAEVASRDGERVVAYRGGHRWVEAVEQLPREAGEPAPVLRQGGTYLVTGGLGTVGLALAGHLAEAAAARLVLTARRPLPAPGEGAGRRAADPDGDEVGRRLRAVRELRERGVDVLVAAADVCDEAAMRRVLEEAEARLGPLAGVIHAAGVVGAVPLLETTAAEAAAVLAPKVRGALVLASLCRGRGLDFALLCSSLATRVAGPRLAAYCAANAFLDAFAHAARTGGGPPFVAVNWDGWREGAMGERAAAELSGGEAVRAAGLSPEEGVRVFRRCLGAGLRQVLVSTLDLEARIARARAWRGEAALREEGYGQGVPAGAEPQAEPREAQEQEEQGRPPGEAAPERGEDPAIEGRSPGNAVERAVAEVWRRVLGVEEVRADDDFFELGGHSLLGTQVLNRLADLYPGADLNLRDLFDHPTVAGLARRLAAASLDSGEAAGEDLASRVARLSGDERRAALADYLRGEIAPLLGVTPGELGADAEVGEADADLVAAQLMGSLKRDLGLPVYGPELRPRRTVARLADFLAGELEARAALVSRAAPARREVEAAVDAEPSADLRADRLPPVAERRSATAPTIAKNPGALFVLTAPRSGSTLLLRMLAGHPALFCPPELWLLGFDTLRAWREDPFAPYYQDGLLHAFRALRGLTVEASRAALEDLLARDLTVAEVYRMLQEEADGRILVDKSPGYALSAETLRRAELLFEGPRYLHLARHPGAVIESFVRNRFDRLAGRVGDPYDIAEEHWRVSQANTLGFLETVERRRWHRLRFEELVAAPERVLREVCDFLGLPFDGAVLEPYAGRRATGGPGDPDLHTHDAIDPSRAEAWRHAGLPRPLGAETRALAEELGFGPG